MRKTIYAHLSERLIGLLLYHGLIIVAMVYAAYRIADMGGRFGDSGTPFGTWDAILLGLAGFAIALIAASCGMVFGNSRGLFLGMICHLILVGLAMAGIVTSIFLFISVAGETDHEVRAWAGFAVFEGMVVVMMCFAFGVPSAWAFLFLRRLRRSSRARTAATN
jgi:hypothetical protein